MFFPGTRIGPYSLTREIGRGTFGVVWLAERRGRLATTRVALKLPVGLSNTDLQLLVRESEIWTRSSGHPNVMPVIEAEEYNGTVVIVTEYAQEGSLETWLTKNNHRAPTLEAALFMTTGILTGLSYLHTRGVIHRDLKPANILLQGGIPRITDFGLARLSCSTKHSYSVAGTPEYMAPEVWRGNRSEQTDLWSVGVMLYEMLTGASPFPNDTWEGLRRAVEFQEPQRLPDAVPARVQNAVYTALQKDPQSRFRSADEMVASLKNPSSPASRIIFDTTTSGLGSIHDKVRDLDSILHALENFTPQMNSHFYIGNTLVKCASFIEDHDCRDIAETLVEDLIGEVESIERSPLPSSERVVSISKVRNLVRYFKQLKREYLTAAQRMTSTASFAS